MATHTHSIFPIGSGLPTVDYPHVYPRFTKSDSFPTSANRQLGDVDHAIAADTARATNAMLASLASILIGGDHV